MPQQLSVADFAATIKKRLPQLASVPDEELTRKILQRRPELITKLTNPPSAPGPPSEPQKPFMDRVLGQIGQNAEGMVQMPNQVISGARQKYLQGQKGESNPRLGSAELAGAESIYENAVEPTVKGAYSLTPPGIVERIANKEDPAKLAGDALMLYAPGGEEGFRAADAMRKPVDPYAAGGLRGSMTRGKTFLDQVESAAKDIPVNHAPAYDWARRAMQMEKYGYTVPAPIKAFVKMVEDRMRPGKEAISGKPGSFIDRGSALNPLTFEDTRNFEKSLGEKIPWEQDRSGIMNGFQKKIREALGQENAAALKPHGLDIPYLRGKSEIEKAYGAKGRFGPIGKIGGKVAGYGAGAVVGHPFALGYGGGKAGESAAGSIVDSVINAGKEER